MRIAQLDLVAAGFCILDSRLPHESMRRPPRRKGAGLCVCDRCAYVRYAAVRKVDGDTGFLGALVQLAVASSA